MGKGGKQEGLQIRCQGAQESEPEGERPWLLQADICRQDTQINIGVMHVYARKYRTTFKKMHT